MNQKMPTVRIVARLMRRKLTVTCDAWKDYEGNANCAQF